MGFYSVEQDEVYCRTLLGDVGHNQGQVVNNPEPLVPEISTSSTTERALDPNLEAGLGVHSLELVGTDRGDLLGANPRSLPAV